MLAGEIFSGMDDELSAARNKASNILSQYNDKSLTKNMEEFERIGFRYLQLQQLMGKLGDGIIISSPFQCTYGFNIQIGHLTYANIDCVFLDSNIVSIGNLVQIGPGVHIYTDLHPIDPLARIQSIGYSKPVHIGDHVWIGGNVTICPGVSIGDNTVIGAGSVVTRNIPSNVLAVGNPCKVIREIEVDEEKVKEIAKNRIEEVQQMIREWMEKNGVSS